MRLPILAVGALCAVTAAPTFVAAQAAPQPAAPQPAAPSLASPRPAAGPTLTLEEAIGIARQNNPTFQQSVNNRRRAGAQLRSAYGALLPSFRTSANTSFREGRQEFFAGQSIGSSADQLSASMSLDAGVSYDVAAFTAPKLQRANAEAVEADIVGAEQVLRTTVTRQYLTALQQEARAQLQDSLVATAEAQLELARARVAVGAATVLDARRAEVTLGQARVNQLQARNQAEVEKLRLFQQMGVQQPENVQLTTRFPVTDAGLTLADLLDQAQRANPTLNALRSREDVASLGVRSARGSYLPTLSLSAGVSGFGNQLTNTDGLVAEALGRRIGNCQSEIQIRNIATGGNVDPTTACAGLSLSPNEISAARARNGSLYDFSRNPYQLTASLSIPIFNGFTREQRVQEAIAGRNDAEYRVRAQQLQLTADVTSAYRSLQTQRQTVVIQEQNAATAREALSLAQERYRVGASSFIDVAQARDVFAQAQTDYINAVYEFHRAFAELENAVGRRLR